MSSVHQFGVLMATWDESSRELSSQNFSSPGTKIPKREMKVPGVRSRGRKFQHSSASVLEQGERGQFREPMLPIRMRHMAITDRERTMEGGQQSLRPDSNTAFPVVAY